jgi:hypothetical protein
LAFYFHILSTMHGQNHIKAIIIIIIIIIISVSTTATEWKLNCSK